MHADAPPRIFLQHRACVMGAVLESVAFLEAYVNEVLKDAADGITGATGGLDERVLARLGGAWEQIESASVLEEFRMVRVLADPPAADRGRRPYDDVAYMVKLRNWLVHNKPRDIGEDSPDRLIDHVRGRVAENPFFSGVRVAWFPDHALSAGCAWRAVESARAFVDEFVFFCYGPGAT